MLTEPELGRLCLLAELGSGHRQAARQQAGSRQGLTSIIAASLYFCTFRTILTATRLCVFLSQHSSTRPKVPARQQALRQLTFSCAGQVSAALR